MRPFALPAVDYRDDPLVHTQRNRLQSFFGFSTLPMFSSSWGVCFSLKANSSGSNRKSFDTVLSRCNGVQARRLFSNSVVVIHRSGLENRADPLTRTTFRDCGPPSPRGS
jgi:hypothetical protein